MRRSPEGARAASGQAPRDLAARIGPTTTRQHLSRRRHRRLTARVRGTWRDQECRGTVQRSAGRSAPARALPGSTCPSATRSPLTDPAGLPSARSHPPTELIRRGTVGVVASAAATQEHAVAAQQELPGRDAAPVVAVVLVPSPSTRRPSCPPAGRPAGPRPQRRPRRPLTRCRSRRRRNGTEPCCPRRSGHRWCPNAAPGSTRPRRTRPTCSRR